MDSGTLFVVIFVLITIGTFYYFTFVLPNKSLLTQLNEDEIEKQNDDNSSEENYTNDHLLIKNENEVDV